MAGIGLNGRVAAKDCFVVPPFIRKGPNQTATSGSPRSICGHANNGSEGMTHRDLCTPTTPCSPLRLPPKP
jgi:hypothetical protein